MQPEFFTGLNPRADQQMRAGSRREPAVANLPLAQEARITGCEAGRPKKGASNPM